MMDRIMPGRWSFDGLPGTPKIETWPIIIYPALETGAYHSRALIYATIDRRGALMECRGVFAGAEELELVTFKSS